MAKRSASSKKKSVASGRKPAATPVAKMSASDRRALTLEILGSVLLAVLGMVYYLGFFKVLTLLTAAGVLVLLAFSDLSRLRRPAVLLLLGFLVFSGLTILWALSGKFFLREFSKLFCAGAILLVILLRGSPGGRTPRLVASLTAGTAAVLGLVSVEEGAVGIFRGAIASVPQMEDILQGFEPGTRLVGILGNANILSSVLAVGIFFSLALLIGARTRGARLLYAIWLGVCAFTFLLCFSMGGVACFAVSALLWLLLAGGERGAALVRMLETAVPTLLFGFLAFPCFDREGAVKALPLLFLVLNVAAIFLLEEKLAPRFVAALEQRPRLGLGVLLALVGAAAVLSLAACHLSGPYTFGEDLRRSAYPEAGVHTLELRADGDVSVTIVSQDRAQTMMHTDTRLYRGPAEGASFTVPEGSTVCYFTFSAAPGVTLQSASVDGTEDLRLDYTLLPGSVANRIQGLWANQNFVQRTVFFQDGMKLFARHPVAGNGVGAFETGATSVQSFFYETKYVHNHYIQVLLEEGVVGFALYAAALAALAVALLRGRRRAEEGMARLLWPALLACFAMILLHSAVEVSLSSNFFLWIAWGVFGLIALLYTEPLSRREKGTGEAGGKEKRTSPREGGGLAFRVVSLALVGLFALTLAGNLAAAAMVREKSETMDGFFRTVSLAAKLDIYEHNDAKLSYVYYAGTEESRAHLEQANAYAGELMEVQSNTIPRYLTSYYLQTGQYEQAIRAAMAGAACSASDPEVWNASAALLSQVLLDPAASPLLTQGEALLPVLEEYVDMWRTRNETAMEELALDETAQAFFRKAEELIGTGGDPEAVAAVLNG